MTSKSKLLYGNLRNIFEKVKFEQEVKRVTLNVDFQCSFYFSVNIAYLL